MKVKAFVAQAIADLLSPTETVFGVLGSGNMNVVRELVTTHEMTYVPAAREDGSVYMAHAYARATGNTGIATVTYGPGLTNAITAVIESVRAHTPVLILCGDYPAMSPLGAFQKVQFLDQSATVAATGAEFRTIRSIESTQVDVVEAIKQVVVDRTAVVLGVPTDLQDMELPNHISSVDRIGLVQLTVDPEQLDQAVGILASARRPIVLGGWGCVVSDAKDDVLELANAVGAPVASTLAAKGLFHGEPNDIGVFGTLSSPAALEIIGTSDCVVAFGASLNSYTAGHGALLRDKAVIHCDADPLAIGRTSEVTAGVVGNAGDIARSMSLMLRKADHKKAEFMTDEHRAALRVHPWGNKSLESGPGTVDLYTTVRRLEGAFEAEKAVVIDGSLWVLKALEAISVRNPRWFLTPDYFGEIGAGIASSIGKAFGLPDKPIVLWAGDGGMLMSLSELNTAIKNNLDLTVIVLNDSAYGNEVYKFLLANTEPDLGFIPSPDFAPLAEAMGAFGTTVRREDDIEAAVRMIQDQSARPLVIDVKLDSIALSKDLIRGD